jgi:hypothetical protein
VVGSKNKLRLVRDKPSGVEVVHDANDVLKSSDGMASSFAETLEAFKALRSGKLHAGKEYLAKDRDGVHRNHLHTIAQ